MNDEYIKTLSDEEKIIFLKAFCAMVRADGVIDTKEVEFLKLISARYDVDNTMIVKIIKDAVNINLVEEVRKITNRKHALQLIKELCVLANVDEELHDYELSIIVDVAQALGIEDDKVVQINRYVLDSFILSKAGKIILEENDE